MSNKVKAVIFDMDGVLIDSEPLWRESTIEVLHDIGIPLNKQDVAHYTGFPASKVAALILDQYKNIKISINELADKINQAGINNVLAHNPLFPNVKETLEYLDNLGIKMGIASASPLYMLEGIVHNCEIAKYFSVLSSATTLSHNKPHPVVYLNALEKLDINPTESYGVEDSIIGMTAVKAANMPCIVIPEHSDKDNLCWALADCQLENIKQIKDIIK